MEKTPITKEQLKAWGFTINNGNAKQYLLPVNLQLQNVLCKLVAEHLPRGWMVVYRVNGLGASINMYLTHEVQEFYKAITGKELPK